MPGNSDIKQALVNVDITDILRSVEISLKDVPRTITTAGGAVIDQITAGEAVEAMACEVMSTEFTSTVFCSGGADIVYVKQVLGDKYHTISRLLSTKITDIVGDLVEGDITECGDITATPFGVLTLSMSIYVNN